MIDWKRKLTSRKFWLAVVAFLTNILYAFNFSNITVEKMTGIVMSGAVVIAYIIGEGMADASNAGQEYEEINELSPAIGFFSDDTVDEGDDLEWQ